MSILTILQGPWAAPPSLLSGLWDIYEARMSRDGRLSAADITAIEAATGKSLDGSRLPVTVVNDVAVIPVMGPTIPRANLLQEMSGATSYAMLRHDIDQALQDRSVSGLLLDIDSPGGSISQLFDTADFIRKASTIKPVMAWTDGSMTSAAQLMGAATNATYIGSDTADLGSIGVIQMHRDISKSMEQKGERTTLIYSGKYKAVGHPYGPLSESDQNLIQARTDYAYTAFVNKMAEYLGLTADAVRADLADARIFTGRQAIDAGLAQGMMSRDDAIEQVRRMALDRKRTTAGGSFAAKTMRGAATMTKADLKEQHPALYAEIYSDGKQEALAGIEEAKRQAATTERERITGILTIPGPGAKAHHDLLMQGIAEGKTAGDVALAIQQKEADLLGTMQQRMQQAAAQPAPAADPGEGIDAEAVATAQVGDALASGAAAWAKRN